MKNIWVFSILSTILLNTGCSTVNTPEAKYKVIEKDDKFEVRDYDQQILAETIVDGKLTNAGNKAFRTLFRYISGENNSKTKLPMTAPVSQESVGKKIRMTAPVAQQQINDKWAVSFMMPAEYTMNTLPEPNNPKVKLRLVPARKMAAVRYSGCWTKKAYLKNETDLKTWMRKKGLKELGLPVWARYNPPFTPCFLRRNEILIEIAKK